MPTWSRKQTEVIFLAIVSFLSVAVLRALIEVPSFFASEMIAVAVVSVIALRKPSRSQRVASGLIPLVPITFAIVTRCLAAAVAFEMTALTVFGASAIAMAASGQTPRWRALSLVSSGFLVLFSASISDGRYAIAFPLLWILGCVWHLVANHWERLDLAMPESVAPTRGLRGTTVIATALVLTLGGFAVKDRVALTRHLAFGFMPTSGGSKWSDPAATHGTGTGDAAIAAQDHAEAFGAVDSEVFLESTEPSLYDMFNDMIGEPMKNRKKGRKMAQALVNETLITMHERAAKSEIGGSAFSTERKPPKKHRHFKDTNDHSIVQWDGPTGIRLAMHRYDTFDGTDWTQSADLSKNNLLQTKIDDNTWFFDPTQRKRVYEQPDRISVGLVKVIRLDSTRVPVPMMAAGVHIKDIDRSDFFGIEQDGCFFMPGRDKIPPLSIVHVASTRMTEDEVIAGCEGYRPGQEKRAKKSSVASFAVSEELRSVVADATTGVSSKYDMLRRILTYLRTQCSLDREQFYESGDTVDEFLRLRRGGDHLFATTAAMMAREIGLQSRLVTGFYVRPDSFDITAGHASVLPSDVHVWAEVQLADGRWFEIEPTPGYQEPDYQPTLWLATQRFAGAYWPLVLGAVLTGFIGYLTRRVWIDWLLSLLWGVASLLKPRRRISLAMQIIETRARFAGHRRPAGRTQRQWVEELTRADASLRDTARRFCDAADEQFFRGSSLPVDESAVCLVRLLRTKTISRLVQEATA